MIAFENIFVRFDGDHSVMRVNCLRLPSLSVVASVLAENLTFTVVFIYFITRVFWILCQIVLRHLYHVLMIEPYVLSVTEGPLPETAKYSHAEAFLYNDFPASRKYILFGCVHVFNLTNDAQVLLSTLSVFFLRHLSCELLNH